ncbi:glycosyltransferase family 8 protein [Gelatoporia subvermispora B]|uniref:Glycosyltransferase family 8 protein n=1 Tax=Ceriporiopsis subvermispora (strain B) TaxID=914234 RepID=M2R420_CERS8|nr:glycosyltransferase family 8 protein [Gelatoporia subvermispora B]
MRYNNYSPLRPDMGTAKHRAAGLGRCSWITVILAVSALLNVVFLCRSFRGMPQAPPSALDNYQHLNEQPIVDASFLTHTPHLDPKENVIVTSLYTDAFATAVATLGHTLNKANSTAGRLLLYLPDKISARALCIATSSGFVPYQVQRIPPPHKGVHRHFLDQYSKLNLWALDELGVKSAVYLDADTLVQRSFDELFTLPFAFGAVPDVYIDDPGFILGFNAGVLFLRPSSAVFDRMVAQIGTARYRPEDAEQSFLNHFYGPQTVRLPYAYNANLAIKRRKPEMWADLKKEARIVHYTMVKPFLQGDYAEVPIEKLEKNIAKKANAWGGQFREEVEEWGQAWKETYELYGTTIAECQMR